MSEQIYVIVHSFLYSIRVRLMQGGIPTNRGTELTEESTARSGPGVYGISVASELSGLGPQTLRLYETRGLLTPARSDGGTRRYSDDDLDRLRRITELLAAGVNLAGIAQIFGLEARNIQLESANVQLTSDRARLESGQHPVAPEGRRRSTGKERNR
jgi:MerR family transcriptional regulator/heat shock protein HspR